MSIRIKAPGLRSNQLVVFHKDPCARAPPTQGPELEAGGLGVFLMEWGLTTRAIYIRQCPGAEGNWGAPLAAVARTGVRAWLEAWACPASSVLHLSS